MLTYMYITTVLPGHVYSDLFGMAKTIFTLRNLCAYTMIVSMMTQYELDKVNAQVMLQHYFLLHSVDITGESNNL